MSELSREARALLELAAKSGRTAPAVARTRMRRTLLAATLLPATAAASASLAKWVVVGVVSAAVGSGLTVLTMRSSGGAPRVAPAPARVVAPSPPSPEVPKPPAEPGAPAPPVVEAPQVRAPNRPREREAPPAAVEAPPEAPAASVEATPPAPERAPVATASDQSLAAELEGLQRILSAVTERRFDDASTGLAEFEARFRSPVLEVEKRVLEVRVRCGQGQFELARELAARLRTKFPRNPAVQRLDSAEECRPR